MPTSPVFILFYVIFQEKETGAVTNLMLCGYSSNASLTFPFRIIFFCNSAFQGGTTIIISGNTAEKERPCRLWRSYGFYTSECVFSLERRDRTGPPHSWKMRGEEWEQEREGGPSEG